MAEYYGVPNNRVHITKGHQSRMKQICINNPQNNLPDRDMVFYSSTQDGK